MPSVKDLQKELSELHKQERSIKDQIADKKRSKMIQCESCEKRTKVSSVTYIQTYWYETPYSCTGGDRWHEGEGQFNCPKCGHNNRLICFKRDKNGNYLNHPYVNLKYYFKEVVKKYDR